MGSYQPSPAPPDRQAVASWFQPGGATEFQPYPQPGPAPRPSEPLPSGGGQSPWSPGGMSPGGYGHGEPGHRGKHYKKRKSWLEEIFD